MSFLETTKAWQFFSTFAVIHHMMKHYGLIGRTLKHSFSKRWFDTKFANEQISDADYSLFELDSIEELLPLIKERQLSGINVTIPYKEVVMPCLQSLSDEALKIGAVNVVKVMQDGTLKGFNTDAPAFAETLKPALKPHHKKALILGTGGASKAVAYALGRLAIDYVWVSRHPEQHLQYVSYEEARILAKDHQLIVNTTPMGMFPKEDETPWPYLEVLTPDHLCYDLIYNPGQTLFMKQAQQQGATVVGGLDMLYRQAELAWQIFKQSE